MRPATAGSCKNLLSREVYDGFETAIREREQRGETVETRFVSIDGADIIGAELRGKTAQVTVRFLSQLVSVTRDQGRRRDRRQSRQGDRRHRRLDVRARRQRRAIPNWKLVATEAGQ